MNVLVVSGIWPPDVGGPASHAPELAEFLAGRGHGVEVVITADGPPASEPYPVRYVSRRIPVGLRHLATVALVARRARANDVVYATGMLTRSALAARLARRPLVAKVTGDEAYERSLRRGLYAGDLEGFQHHRGGLQVRALRRSRDLALRGAAHVFCPSRFLAELVEAWGVPAGRITVLPNPAPEVPGLAPREELRAAFGFERPTLVFAGRLMAAKALDVALAAAAQVPEADLVLAGDGPDRPELEARAAELGLGARARFLGAQPRERVLELFRAADAHVLSSAWENFPHTLVEALAVGTPVVATSVGGVPEIVTEGENGLLVPPGDPAALAGAVRRLLGEPGLRDRLAAAAAPSVARFAPAVLTARIEETLARVARQ